MPRSLVIQGTSLEELVNKAALKIPKRRVGSSSACQLIQLSKKPRPQPEYGNSVKIKDGVWAVCSGECPPSRPGARVPRCTVHVEITLLSTTPEMRLTCSPC